MHTHRLTCLVMFLPRSWCGRDKKWQLRDTRLNVQSSFALPRISTSNFGIFKGYIIIFEIALSNDNQWTVEWHTWLPYKTNQLHVQHDFRFSSKRPVLDRAWQKYVLSAQSNFNYCRKVLSMKTILINIKTKNVRQNPCCVGSLLQYICIDCDFVRICHVLLILLFPITCYVTNN